MVDLALQLLHIAVGDILVARVLLIALAVLLLKAGLSISIFLIDVLDNPVDVLPLADLDKNASFEVEHGLLDDPVVKVDHVARDLALEVGILVHDRFELIFAKTVGINVV